MQTILITTTAYHDSLHLNTVKYRGIFAIIYSTIPVGNLYFFFHWTKKISELSQDVTINNNWCTAKQCHTYCDLRTTTESLIKRQKILITRNNNQHLIVSEFKSVTRLHDKDGIIVRQWLWTEQWWRILGTIWSKMN